MSWGGGWYRSIVEGCGYCECGGGGMVTVGVVEG